MNYTHYFSTLKTVSYGNTRDAVEHIAISRPDIQCFCFRKMLMPLPQSDYPQIRNSYGRKKKGNVNPTLKLGIKHRNTVSTFND